MQLRATFNVNANKLQGGENDDVIIFVRARDSCRTYYYEQMREMKKCQDILQTGIGHVRTTTSILCHDCSHFIFLP